MFPNRFFANFFADCYFPAEDAGSVSPTLMIATGSAYGDTFTRGALDW